MLSEHAARLLPVVWLTACMAWSCGRRTEEPSRHQEPPLKKTTLLNEKQPLPDKTCVGATPRTGEWLRVMTYNIRHGELAELETLAQVIRDQEPDLIAVQEVDVGVTRSNTVDQARELGRLTGLEHAFFPALQYEDGLYGVAVLSRWPIKGTDLYYLSSTGEQRILAIARVHAQRLGPINFAVTHLGLGADERRIQAGEIAGHLEGLKQVVLAGDFNELPGAPVYGVLTAQLHDVWTRAGDGDGPTFPAGDRTRRIDWILVSPDFPSPEKAWVTCSQASDHSPVVAIFGAIPPVPAK